MEKLKLNSKDIDNTIDQSENFVDALIRLYKLVVKDFDKVSKLSGFPVCNQETAKYILDMMFVKYPKNVYDINLMWLNKGFSSNGKDLMDFEFEIPDNIRVYD